MDTSQQRALLSIALMAAAADGGQDQRERAELRRIATDLAGTTDVSLSSIYQDVLLGRVSLEQSAAAIDTPERRQLAYELAVCVCDADGVASPAERAFLAKLAQALRLEPAAAAAMDRRAAEMADAPLVPVANAAAGAAVVAGEAAATGLADVDRTILNYAVANGALELLPESLSTLAIIPLQMRMVYRIGQHHGYALDKGHIRDLLGTLGVGLTSQYVEGIARKLLGGLFGGIGRQIASSGMSFVTTYALGHVAKAYYSGGRTLSMDDLKQTFARMVTEGKTQLPKYAADIQQRARTINVPELLGSGDPR
jgi:tellurite resistance protein/uncharacterized protein (DUF697 family)